MILENRKKKMILSIKTPNNMVWSKSVLMGNQRYENIKKSKILDLHL